MARRLYHEHAASQPIIDYHSHLPPAEIAEDRQFANLARIWPGSGSAAIATNGGRCAGTAEAMLGALIRDICFNNARDYFRIQV